MSNPDPTLTFIRVRNVETRILIVRAEPWTFDRELVDKIRSHRHIVLQGLHDDWLAAEGRGTAVCLRIDHNASPGEIEDAVSRAIVFIARVIADHHEWEGWDESEFVIHPKEIRWQNGGALPTTW